MLKTGIFGQQGIGPLNLRLGGGREAAARSNTLLQAREAAGTEGDPSYSCVGNKATG